MSPGRSGEKRGNMADEEGTVAWPLQNVVETEDIMVEKEM